MNKYIDLEVTADADQDDCLAAAASAYIEEHPALAGYDLSPRWTDEDRESVTLSVPSWSVADDFETCATLIKAIEAVMHETIRIEEHDEVPGEWGVWAAGGADPEILGAGPTIREALEDALATAREWTAAR